uniref:Ig-like domain-containing protein n=1 Tax=Pygocentrus nattereri TaxID=42514 RepID=A0A3B4D018_PYGNA
MITLLTTLCLFTTVNTEMSELHVRTVRSGSNVTIKCDQNMDNDNKKYLSWYKQSSGKVPEYVVRSFQGIRYASGSNDGRFTVDKETFDLTINAKNEEDAGLYFCGKVKQNAVEFESGTLLLFQGESHPGIIYTHGNRSDECEKSSETDSPTQSCVYKLPTRNLSLSDAGTHYCAVAACERILFGKPAIINVKGKTFERIELLFCDEISLCGDFFEQFLFII